MSDIPKRQWWLLIAGLTIVHLIGMIAIDIMDVDAAQYASISQEMMQTGEYLQVHHRYEDYLDKPPLLFWVTSICYEIFGASNFTFRLPSFLFLILGLFATYKLGEELYDKKTGQLAVLVLYSTQAYFLFSHDVRTDTILANVVIFAIWQLWLFISYGKLSHMVLGAIGVALAMLEKGPIGLMVPVLALGTQVLFTRNLKVILRWEWLVGLLVIAIMLAPMVYGLHQQFGMHGVEFYFWTQSFGRITGQSEWQDNSTVFYFVHTFLWAFLPWMFIAYFGIFKNLVTLVKARFKSSGGIEVITLAGFILTFMAMSLSRYKLPHYIFVVFPLAAIITARTFWSISESLKSTKVFTAIQGFTNTILFIIVGLLAFISFAPTPWYVLLPAVACLIAAVYYTFVIPGAYNKIVMTSLLTMLGVNFIMSAHIYPSLLQYQSGSEAGRFIAERGSDEEVYSYKMISHSFDFYSGKVAPLVSDEYVMEHKGIILYLNESELDNISSLGVEYEVIKAFDHYHVTEVTTAFLSPATRDNTLNKRYLIKIL